MREGHGRGPSPTAFLSSTCPAGGLAAPSGGEGQEDVGVRGKCWGSPRKRRILLLSEQGEGDLVT